MEQEINSEVLEGQDEQQEDNTPQVSEVEQRALDMGWRPKEEFDGSDDEFIDAKEFVRRRPLFEKIEGQGREIKNMRKALEAWKQHYTQVEKTSVEKALAQLKAARKEAVSNADGDKYDALDDEIKAAEQNIAQIKQLEQAQIPQEQQIPPEFANWQNRNRWYTETKYMRTWADDFGTELAKQGLEPATVLKRVEEAVKKEFPDKFRNSNKQSAPDMDSGTARRTVAKTDDFELSPMEEKIMNDLVRTKQMTRKEYIESLKKIR